MTAAATSSTGTIQPVGFLITVTGDWRISQVSANIDRFFATTAEQLIGQPASSLLTADAIHDLRNRLTLMRDPDVVERLLACPLAGGDEQFDVSLHVSGECVVIEGEPARTRFHGDIAGIVRGMVRRLEETTGVAGLFNEGARQVRSLTGFDQVKVHRFDAAGSGEIVAECTKSGIGSRLGENHAASSLSRGLGDRRGRALLQFVADSEAAAVPIISRTVGQGRPIDLSRSVLCSTTPDHLQSLRNMKIRSEVSLSLVVAGKPWGMIMCHHGTPRCPDFERRSVAELFAEMFAMRIEIRELQAALAPGGRD